jgi:glycogen operon protein
LLSRGVPMLLAGDELGRTQRGNNNPYCQDSELSWLDWEGDAGAFADFVARVLKLRKAHPALRMTRFSSSISWLTPHAQPMTEADWQQPFARCLGALFSGGKLDERDEHGRAVVDDDLLLLLNAHDGEIAFTLPEGNWKVLLDTFEEKTAGTIYSLQARSLALLVKPASGSIPTASAPARTDA